MIRTTITIQECYGDHATTVTTHNTDDTELAIRRAVSRRYGKSRYFVESFKLTRQGNPSRHRYGQVGHGVPRKHGGGTSLDTGRVYIGIQQEV